MGIEFVEIFEEWADDYDQTVLGHDLEYKEVFYGYDKILQNVADRAFGQVLEFGPGTGNLTLKLLDKGLNVIGVEPSQAMRNLAKKKIADRAKIIEGDFFRFPKNISFQTITSTYAFHHLTDEEKEAAVAAYRNLLPIGGKIVFADTMYPSVDAYQKAISDAYQKGYHSLAEDLQREYYTTIPILVSILEQNGFDGYFERSNDFVWIMEAVKK